MSEPQHWPTTHFKRHFARLQMDLRDQFAMAGLTALGGHKAVTARGIPWLVEHAYMVADAMLAEREKEQAK